ncbi:hypothetical protein BDV95DRAFT_610116 [Massariosphaeria phaeospora]|uniref:F-box domain-containing protein n=1 Tax=Massariosphaeria phaeospora TaxID=100035 RepID=A0A7C8I384_9PLEO|nr:hypothetical protein BDV95DRAFT_610116 [Massariosphaeria phaeospora]
MGPYRQPPPRLRECDPLWYLDYYELPHYLRAPPGMLGILTLPNEIVTAIATKLTHNRDLYNLALVNRRLRDVAQEAMVKHLVLPENRVRMFVAALWSRPDLAQRIKRVDLGDYGKKMVALEQDKLGGDIAKLFVKLVNQVPLQRYTAPKTRYQIWPQGRMFYFAILVSLCSNLESLCVEFPPMHTSLGSEPQECLSPFHGPGLQLLQDRLQKLTIVEPTSWKGRYMHNLCFKDFGHLRRLSLPLGTMVSMEGHVRDPKDVLPPTLQQLDIRACDRFTFSWFLEFWKGNALTRLTALKRISLHFKTCLRSSLLLIDEGRDRLRLFRDILLDLKLSGLTVDADSRTQEGRYNLMGELDAWSRLSQKDAWLAALNDEQFSVAASRGPESKARKKALKLQPVLDLKNPQDLPILFASPTFKAEAWHNVRFFGGVQEAEFEINEPAPESLTEHRHQRKRMEKEQKPLGQVTSKGLSTIDNLKFDGSYWLGVRFFDTPHLETPAATKESTSRPRIPPDRKIATPRMRHRKATTHNGKAMKQIPWSLPPSET